MLLSLQDRAKELGVKQKFDDLVKVYKSVDRERRKSKASKTMLDQWTNFTGPYDNMMCGAWIAGDDGIHTFNKDYSNEVLACYHPILPIKRMKNLETGEEQLRVAYKRNHSWKEITVPKDLVSSASKIVSLSKLGVAVTSENAKLLVKYLSDVENLNDDAIPVQMSSSKLGWIGDGFIPYDTEIVFDGDMQFKSVFESISSNGNKTVWLDYLKNLRKTGRMEIKFLLAASLASVLVAQVGALPFIVDLWGETEGGKTVALMMAASVWANPADSQYIGDFKTTDVALETKCNLLNHLPLMLDDSSKTSARIRDNFEGVVYDLCSGKGKSRSNKELGIRRENNWKNVIITNGERPLSSYVGQGGAINRILEVECRDHVFPDPQEAAETFKKNYGHLGKQFVKVLKKLGRDGIREIQQEIQRKWNADKCGDAIASAIAGKTVQGNTGSGSSTPSKPSAPASNRLKVDGYWGPKLTRRLQQIFGTQVDGVVSNQFSCYRAQNPGLDAGWEWESKPSGYSPLIKEIQRHVGVKQDGHIGPNTIRAIQKWLGCVQDGCFSRKSPCIKKLQEWCNRQ